MLFISGFSPDFYSVNDNSLCLIIDRIKNAIVATSYAVAFFCSELSGTLWSWIGGEGKDCSVNGSPVFYGNLFSIFF